jgi:hypothetical protein
MVGVLVGVALCGRSEWSADGNSTLKMKVSFYFARLSLVSAGHLAERALVKFFCQSSLGKIG